MAPNNARRTNFKLNLFPKLSFKGFVEVLPSALVLAKTDTDIVYLKKDNTDNHIAINTYSSSYVFPFNTDVTLTFVGNGTNTLIYVDGTLISTLACNIGFPFQYFFADESNSNNWRWRSGPITSSGPRRSTRKLLTVEKTFCTS